MQDKTHIFIDKAAYVWNDDNNSMLAINNFITFIENPLVAIFYAR
jgi:hypothetical protein